MKNDDIQSELARLRAEVAALSKARREQELAAQVVREESEQTETAEGDEDEGSSHRFELDVKGQIEELAELLEKEMRDSPLVTCLAVFAAGVLVGRIIR